MKLLPGIFLGTIFLCSPALADILLAQPPTDQAVQPAAAVEPQLQVAEIDKDAVIKRLRDQNAQLREKIATLDQENAELKGRIEAMTSLGGSEVHAYCSDTITSRNTAGAEAVCRDAGGFTCEAVSGLCRTSCQTTDMCAPGWTCDTEIQQCINTSGG